MHFYHVVLLALLALVAGIETLATATESSEIDIPKKEMLKITALIHHNGVNDGRLLRSVHTDTEERDIASFIRRAQVQYWLKVGKSKDYVKKMLGLKGLKETALKASPEYKNYEDFKINKRDPMPLDDTETRQLYLRYAIEYDDLLFEGTKESDKIKIMLSPSPAEMEARIRIWVMAKRPDWYVEKMLGLENNAQLKRTSKEYQLFLKLQKEQK
ncbi:hypothetical protein PI124_g17982 [Phytophthora idaei]|nr:hypothetical protein PI125_g21649 [Phytophthora idaei]KAG3131647.1 hypothetical protein PI126_g19970 [Phytophthora idaei]KAG3237014.1 hypothetical protein PI124_g17982 [Phytophthora idaei]